MNKNILIGLFLFVVINYSKPSGLNCGLWIVSFWFFVIFPFKFKRERQRQRDGDKGVEGKLCRGEAGEGFKERKTRK